MWGPLVRDYAIRWIEAASPNNAEDETRRAGARPTIGLATDIEFSNEQNGKHNCPLEHELEYEEGGECAIQKLIVSEK